MRVLELSESQLRFFLSGEFDEAEAAMVLRVHFLWQAHLLDVTKRLEKLTDLLGRALEREVLDEKLL